MPEDGGLIGQALIIISLKPMNAWVHTYTKPQTSSTRSRGLGRRIHESVEDTKLSTNKQHSLLSSSGAKNLFKEMTLATSGVLGGFPWLFPMRERYQSSPLARRGGVGQRTEHGKGKATKFITTPIDFIPVRQLHLFGRSNLPISRDLGPL